ncbi:Asp23/Gls24 family envelope stress response protein [Adlercreutzia sp. ZJ138]|uniref:Asp23/Gls24 family envelope stress response protein n=1 Tax=Adlercreutzia sp. ZJ138 TaxID=2709405 RepID=UPI001F153BF5|nr:Asp23/Gls24 family envelope stress response protein [Adlercreutzia sp. ZJ138]
MNDTMNPIRTDNDNVKDNPSPNITSPDTPVSKASDALRSVAADHDEHNDHNERGYNMPDTPEPKYILTINEDVVEKISLIAARKVDGIIDMKGSVFSRIQEGLGGSDDKKGVQADVGDGTARVELSIILEYGKSAIDVFEDIKDSVTEQVKDMTGLTVTEIIVNVVDVADRAAWEAEHADTRSTEDADRRTHVTLAQS